MIFINFLCGELKEVLEMPGTTVNLKENFEKNVKLTKL